VISTKRLQGKMKEMGITLDALSKQIGLSRTGLFNKIHNKVEFTATEIEEVGRILKLSASEVFAIFFVNYVD